MACATSATCWTSTTSPWTSKVACWPRGPTDASAPVLTSLPRRARTRSTCSPACPRARGWSRSTTASSARCRPGRAATRPRPCCSSRWPRLRSAGGGSAGAVLVERVDNNELRPGLLRDLVGLGLLGVVDRHGLRGDRRSAAQRLQVADRRLLQRLVVGCGDLLELVRAGVGRVAQSDLVVGRGLLEQLRPLGARGADRLRACDARVTDRLRPGDPHRGPPAGSG